MNDKHLTAMRETKEILRKAKADIETILTAIENERTLLPERLWRTTIDDDMIEVEVSVEGVLGHVDCALNSVAEVMGEDDPLEDNHPRYAPLPDKLPTYEQVDAKRRAAARALRERGADGGAA